MPRRALVLALLPLGWFLSLDQSWAGPGDQQADQAAEEGEEAEPPTEEERIEAFAAVEAELSKGQKARAADALTTLISDTEREYFHAEAYARLGQLLMELDLSYGALVAYSRALALDPGAEFAGQAIERSFELADRVGDTAILEPVFAQNVGGDVDRATRSRMAYLAARENYRQGHHNLALSLIKLVIAESPVYADAKMLEGVVLNQQGRANKALAPLQTALAAAEKSGRDSRFVNTALLNLGRSYYASGNFPRAIEHFARVSRESDFWLEAQFERAWAHFRLEDMNGTIAMLHNHDSPFFESYYYPEGELLRVYALFLLCKFPEASLEIDEFKERYAPVWEILKTSTASMSPQEAFDTARRYVDEGDPGPIPEMVLQPLRGEARLAAAIGAAEQAEDEVARLKNISANPFAAQVSSWVSARGEEIVSREGERIKARLAKRSDELAGMLTNVEISKLDMLQMETRLYEQASVLGKQLDKARQVQRKERIRKGYVHWPWQGEYWVDEVGYYRVSAVPECPSGLRASEE